MTIPGSVSDVEAPSGVPTGDTHRERLGFIVRAMTLGLFALAVAYVIVCAYLATQVVHGQRMPVQGTPSDVGLAYESIVFASNLDQVELHGWLMPSASDRAVIMLHGLDSNRWDGQTPRLARVFVDDGLTVLAFDLRGLGESGGEHLGLGWLDRGDVQAAIELLERRGYQPGQIGLYGASYGTTAALLSAAASPDVGAVVVDSAIADERDVVNGEVTRRTGLPPVFSPSVSFLALRFYGLDLEAIAPVRAVPAIGPRPIFFIHGTADTRVPVTQTYKLAAAAHNPANRVWIVPGAGHTEAFELHPVEYAAAVTDFYDDYLPTTGPVPAVR